MKCKKTLIFTLILNITFSQACLAEGYLNKGLIDKVIDRTENNEADTKIEDLNKKLDRTDQIMSNIETLNSTQKFFDNSKLTDNTMTVEYDPKKIIKIRVREFMGTFIKLPEHDFIKDVLLGDTKNFYFNMPEKEDPNQKHEGNVGSVQVAIAGADTSLNLIGTSGNVYTFYLRGDTFKSPFAPTMKVYLEDYNLIAKLDAKEKRDAILRKAKEKKDINLNKTPAKKDEKEFLTKVPFDPTKMYFGYKIVGGKQTVKPYIVYDEGNFTYFRFTENDDISSIGSLPVLFRVADKTDVPVSTTVQGSVLRGTGVSNKWTLRIGNDHLCIERIKHIPNVETAMNEIKIKK